MNPMVQGLPLERDSLTSEETDIEGESVDIADTGETSGSQASTLEGAEQSEPGETSESVVDTLEDVEQPEPGVVSESEAGALEDVEEPEPDDGREWYVIHSYSGYENKVKQNLEQRIETMGMQDKIFGVVVPTEEEVEIRDGQRRTTERRMFPGYVLVQMIMDDESWYVVRNTPGVTGFVGSGTRPVPLSSAEVDKILERMETEQPRIKVSFRVGETVRITDGPFADFMAAVDELYLERGKVRLLVSFFGRETPVEMDILQVERI